MENKKISINTDFLKLDKTKKNKKEKKIKPIIKANTLKKELIKKIKKKQNSFNEDKTKIGIDENDFENDFFSSIQYLDSLIKEKKEKNTKKKKFIQTPQQLNVLNNNPEPIIIQTNSLQIPDKKISFVKENNNTSAQTVISDDPQYGCLRNGTKPCYREFFNKTLKKNSGNSGKKLIKKRKIKNKKYVVGKTSKDKSIKILIKNNKTRKKIQDDFAKIKRKSLSEIKQELFKKNLIKIGTVSPPDVLRTIYEQSMLAGDIKNSQKEISLHNFLNDEENMN